MRSGNNQPVGDGTSMRSDGVSSLDKLRQQLLEALDRLVDVFGHVITLHPEAYASAPRARRGVAVGDLFDAVLCR